MTIGIHGFELRDWQRRAVEAWTSGIGDHDHFGTIEVVTGGGKSLIALACLAEAARVEPEVKVAIVVPTQALAKQWRDLLTSRTSLGPEEVGLVGAGGRGHLDSHRAVVCVLNTAAQKLPTMAARNQPLMLIVDECHRAGAPKFSRVLDTQARFRLGLSATPDRDEINDDGELLAYDEQIVGRRLGGVAFRFGLKEARRAGWLPEFVLHHHAVSLLPDERARYDALSRQVDDAGESLRGLGGDTGRSRQLTRRRDELGDAARRWVALTGQRKDLLYRASERGRIASLIVGAAFETAERSPRVLLFHERVDQAVALHDSLAQALPNLNVALEHSKLAVKARERALADFSSGQAPVLVSVKSLIEGIDVPAADTGVSVASSASVRQRVQALGRVLRRSTDAAGNEKRAEMHLIYVNDSVDDLIYGKTDWSDLTGESSNRYWCWPAGAAAPEPRDGPPRSPKPTEDAAWHSLRDAHLPAEWPGEYVGQEYSVGTDGVVHNAFRRLIRNPQSVDELVARVRGRSGGKFRVSPMHRLILVWDARRSTPGPILAGRLDEPFELADEVEADTEIDATELVPGAEYTGPTNKDGGVFRISQRGDGTIERTVRTGREFADTAGEEIEAENAVRTIENWARLDRPTSRFFVNNLEHAWFESDGRRLFLADVTGGFRWPEPEGDKE